MEIRPNFAVPLAKPDPTKKPLPCPFTAQGILQPSHLQPPPMFGPRGPTIPPKHLAQYKPQFKHNRPPSAAEQHQPAAGRFQPRNNFNRPRFHQHTNNRNPSHPNNRQPHFNSNNNNSRTNDGSSGNSWSTAPTRNREFWCEPCDRDFGNVDQLAVHRSEHQKCGIDGCPFEGHELMVSKHIQQQHSTGLYDRIKNLNTPEDIAKWREERRKKYPTKENVQIRQQIQEAKQKRGERLEESKSRFGRKEDRRQPPATTSETSGSSQHAQRPPDAKKAKRPRKRKPRNVKEAIVTSTTTVETNDNTFGGTGSMKGYKHPKEVNVLSGLLGMYGSDESGSDCDDDDSDDQDVDDDKDEKIDGIKAVVPIQMEPIVDKTVVAIVEPALRDEDAPEEAAVNREAYPEPVIPEIATPLAGPSKPNKRTGAKPSPMAATNAKKPKTILDLSKRYRNQNTMLEKLLQKDIRHERNVLLQCVRHVVGQHFFGIETPPPPEEKDKDTNGID